MRRSKLFLIFLLTTLFSGMASPGLPAQAQLLPAAVTQPAGPIANFTETHVAPAGLVDGDGFGYSMAMNGYTLVVGAYQQDSGGKVVNGAAYVYYKIGDSWTQIQKLVAPDGVDYDQFGYAVAIDGDTLVVSADGVNVGSATNQGAAYIFYRNQGGADNWGFVKRLDSSQNDAFAGFGHSLAVQGDEIFVGADGLDIIYAMAGGAFVFRRNLGGTNNWGQVQLLKDDQGKASDAFGAALAVDGDWLVVGGQRTDISGPYENDGAAFLFHKNPGTQQWDFFKKIFANDAHSNDDFGFSVDILGDLVLVGAPFASPKSVLSAGKAYLFQRNAGGINNFGQIKMLYASDLNELSYFGSQVALAPSTAMIGATSARVDGFTRGAAYQYLEDWGGDGAWRQAQKFIASDGYTGDVFGHSLYATSEMVLVGATYGGIGGQVYAYTPAPPAVPVTVYLPVALNASPPVTHNLADGQTVDGPDGMRLGAPAGTLNHALPLTLRTVPQPSTPLFNGATPHGLYYQVSSPENASPSGNKAFVIGIPVPAGTPTTQLGLAVHSSAEDTLDLDGTTFYTWAPLPGRYDAASGLFLAALPAISPFPQTIVLVEHSMFTIATTQSAAPQGAQPGSPQVSGFFALCISPCKDELKQAATQQVMAIYNEFRTTYTYPEPRLEGDASNLDLDPPLVGNSNYYFLTVYDTSNATCDKVLGAYRFRLAQLYLCADTASATALDDEQKDTLRHEMFHAFQSGFPKTLEDLTSGQREKWVTEGTAEAAVKSGVMLQSPQAASWVRSAYYLVRYADDPLRSDEGSLAYKAQDFWVYSGRYYMGGAGLEYLKNIFNKGARIEDVVSGFPNAKTSYWKWVLNQVFEKHDNLEGALEGPVCSLTPNGFNQLSWLFTQYTQTMEGTAHSLEPEIVEIIFTPAMAGQQVTVQVQQVPPPGGSDPDFRYKLMRDKDASCRTRADNASVPWTIAADEHYYVVIANTSLDDKNYLIQLEVAP